MRVALDCDDVLADCMPALLDVVQHVTDRRYRWEDIPNHRFESVLTPEEEARVWAHIDMTPGWCGALEPVLYAVERVEEIRDLGCEVYCVTSPTFRVRDWMYDRAVWLMESFKFAKPDIYFASNKARVDADVFVDDNAWHVQDWAAEHPDGLAIFMRTPPYRHKLPDLPPNCAWATGLSAVVEIIKNRMWKHD